MKKILLILAFTFLASYQLCAKTTYVPTYYTQINVESVGFVYSDSTARRELSMLAKDKSYSLTILHDSVTAERVKAIKSMKAAAGWATAAAILSGVSATLNPVRTSWDAVNYMSSVNNMASSSMLHVASKNAASNLQRVNVTIIFENLSDKEMMVNDMSRGLTWYVPAHNYIELSVGNPEVNKLRVSYAESAEKKDYITIQAANYLEKQTISYEDEESWYYPVYKPRDATSAAVQGPQDIDHYEKVHKVTFEHTLYSKEDFKELKKTLKEAEKQKK